MPKPLSEQVIVITGASSGIGRCTALYIAARGARVVVTARRGWALDSLVREIEERGGRALAVPGDVTREEHLRAVASAAVERFGRIDTWVNNASVFIQGRVQDITLEEFRRVIEVNLLGCISGTRCALDVMLPQGSGVIVQVSSIAAKRGLAYGSPYSAAKAAIDGFTGALRSELWGTGVHFSILYPPPVDTPVYHHARGKMGVLPKPLPPVEDPAKAARAIAKLAVNGTRHRYFGYSRPVSLVNAAFPALGDWLGHHLKRGTLSDVPPGEDNLYAPIDSVPPVVRMGWAEPGFRGLTLREAFRVLPVETMMGIAALGFLATRWASKAVVRGRVKLR